MPPDRTNWAKVLGELLADHELASARRLPTVVAEAVATASLPPELAKQVATAARLLHEASAPPLASLVADEVERQVTARLGAVHRDA
jgi:hypothetical protein